MKPLGYILSGVTTTTLIAAAVKPQLIWLALPLLGLSLAYFLPRLFLYRPPEDHLGVIYRLGRFSRLLAPHQWAITLPGVHQTKEPISLHIRRLEVEFPEVLTQDQVPVDCNLVVYYQRDLRHADAALRTEALRIPDQGWNTVIRTVLRETIDELVSGVPFQQLLTATGRGDLRRALSLLLGRRVERLGLIIKPQTGVSIQMIKPADVVWEAMIERLAAESLGEAARARVYPILEELSRRHPEIAWEALLLEWAGQIAKHGAGPQVLVAPDQTHLAALAGKSRHESDGRSDTEKAASGLNGRREADLGRAGAPLRGLTGARPS